MQARHIQYLAIESSSDEMVVFQEKSVFGQRVASFGGVNVRYMSQANSETQVSQQVIRSIHQVFLQRVLLVLVTIVPYLTGMSGLIYLVTALILGGRFLYWAIRMRRDPDKEIPMQVFRFSIAYLMYLFAALLIDHYYIIRLPF